MKIRNLYEQQGVAGFYRQHGNEYFNPHFQQVEELLVRNIHRFDCSAGVLDFCAGGGEVTRVLQKLGVQNIVGCDPFTHDLFIKNTGLPCLPYSFDDVLRGAPLGQFSTVFSSFALHLCPAKSLFSVVWQLFDAAPTVVIITPHKRPELEKLSCVQLIFEDAAITGQGKRVRLKMYKRRRE